MTTGCLLMCQCKARSLHLMQSLALYHSRMGCCCRELQALRVASAAGTGSTAAPDAQQAQHARQLAAAQQACDEAKADSTSLQNTVQHLQSGC